MRLAILPLLAAALAPAQQGWWMREPIRWVQTNLRETDTALDPARLIGQLRDMRANVLLFGMGGIVAHYPTEIPFHTRSPHLPPNRDTFGEVLKLAHANGIRVIGRFDFSKTAKDAFDAHPEWFFRQANSQPVVYNGLYSTCINGLYYREHAPRILNEALTRYDVDGVFFNMFGNQSTTYSGDFVGHCHCDACRAKFRARFNRDLPAKPDADYERFMFESSREVAAEFGKIIRARRPQAGYFNYIQEYTDGIMSESNTAVRRPLPLWPYASSDNVNRARNSEPGKMAVNLCMSFVDYPWRFVTVPAPEIALRLWQNVAHGGAAALNMHGTPDQQDRHALEAARPVYQFLADHQDLYAGQQSAARVLLLGRPPGGRRGFNQAAYRGLFRLLSEEHIPFAVADNLNWIGQREFDVVLAADWAPRELATWVERGGRLLIASARRPEFEIGTHIREHTAVQGYIRVRTPQAFPSLRLTSLLMLNGDFQEYERSGETLPRTSIGVQGGIVGGYGAPEDAWKARIGLSLIPGSMFGPPEKVHIDMKETDIPALIEARRGQGRVIHLPFDLGGMYYQFSTNGHAELFRDLMDRLLEGKRQIRTNAHPLVEVTLMRQQSPGRTLVHLINLSGHSQTNYFEPIPMLGIELMVEGPYTRYRALRAAASGPTTRTGAYAAFTLPRLADYEVVVLE